MLEVERPVDALHMSSIPLCPYRGLMAFREQDASFFFGREGFTQRLVQACLTEPFTAVVGSVGAGKSSVLNAGLIPHLRQERSGWLIATLHPGHHPYRALAGALLRLYGSGVHQRGVHPSDLPAEVE